VTRSIPGSVTVDGREFMYVKVFSGDRFSKLLDEAEELDSVTSFVKSGGVIEEKAQLAIDDGSRLLAISYKGDIDGWRRLFIASCEKHGRRWGVARGGKLKLSDGTEIRLTPSSVTFER